jgi:CO/xanthine dehydrogenase FAD-binding subunit
LLAGGQTLVPMMNFRLAAPAVIVDLNRVKELDFIEVSGEVVRIGAMTRQRTLGFSPVIADKVPLLSRAVQMVGHLPTRSRGTIGGSLANADSAAELPMALQVLEGEVVVAGPNGQRSIKAADLFVDSMVTTIEEDEILTEIRIPVMAPGARYAADEFSRRRGDFAIAAIATLLTFEDGRCRTARLASAGVSPASTRLLAAERMLEGEIIDAALIARAGEAAAAAIAPMADRNASEAYRRHLTKTLTMRVLTTASSGCGAIENVPATSLA